VVAVAEKCRGKEDEDEDEGGRGVLLERFWDVGIVRSLARVQADVGSGGRSAVRGRGSRGVGLGRGGEERVGVGLVGVENECVGGQEESEGVEMEIARDGEMEMELEGGKRR
jgi:hypothetical protein